MKHKFYMEQLRNLLRQNGLLKVVVLANLGVTGVLGIMFNGALNNQKVIIIPSHLQSKIEVQGNHVSEQYLKEMTRYVLGLAVSYSASSAKNQFAELLPLFNVTVYDDTRESFEKLERKIVRNQISQIFYLSKIKFSENTMVVEGILRRTIKNKEVFNGKATFNIEYQIILGKFAILGLWEEKEKDEKLK